MEPKQGGEAECERSPEAQGAGTGTHRHEGIGTLAAARRVNRGESITVSMTVNMAVSIGETCSLFYAA